MVAERDAASPPDINQLADRVESEFGTLDLPFVNAGTACFMRFESVTEAAYEELFSLNTKGRLFHGAEACSSDSDYEQRKRCGFRYLDCEREGSSSEQCVPGQ